MTPSGAPRRLRALSTISQTVAAALAASAALVVGVASASASIVAHGAQLPAGLPIAGNSTPGSTAPGKSSSAPSSNTPASPKGAPVAPVTTVLTSYAQGFDHWAYPRRPGTSIRSGPGVHYRTVAHLHSHTEDGLPEVYQVLAERTGGPHGTWFDVVYPGRPNGRSGWVPASALGALHLVRAMLVVSARAEHMWYYRNGRLAFSAPVGDGKGSTPTPSGHFYIREKFPVAPGYPVYGPFAMGTSDYSTTLTDWPGGGVVGIHGTDQPQLIPGAPSHGCVRLRNGDITRLYGMVAVGTPLLVKD